MKRSGFSLIELMIVVCIIASLSVLAIKEYGSHIDEAKRVKARTDLEELANAIRRFQLKEEKPFAVDAFVPNKLATFVGTYLEKLPPLDPWGHAYRNNPNLGVVYSLGANGIDDVAVTGSGPADDIFVRYLPEGFYINKAEYVDTNRNNVVDYGDVIEVSFTRPAKMSNVSAFDFQTEDPDKALGSVVPICASEGMTLQLIFAPPIEPKVQIGKTKIRVRDFCDSITDFSNPPQALASEPAVVITRKPM